MDIRLNRKNVRVEVGFSTVDMGKCGEEGGNTESLRRENKTNLCITESSWVKGIPRNAWRPSP